MASSTNGVPTSGTPSRPSEELSSPKHRASAKSEDKEEPPTLFGMDESVAKFILKMQTEKCMLDAGIPPLNPTLSGVAVDIGINLGKGSPVLNAVAPAVAQAVANKVSQLVLGDDLKAVAWKVCQWGFETALGFLKNRNQGI